MWITDRLSSATIRPAGVFGLDPARTRWDQEDEHHDRDRRAVPVLAGLEGLLVHGEGDEPAGLPWSTECHHVDQVEELDDVDDQRHREDRRGQAHHRQHDPEEDLPFARAFDAGRLDDLGRNALDCGRQDDRREADGAPDAHRDERAVDEVLIAQPRDGRNAEIAKDRVEHSDVAVRRVDELPDHRERGGRDGHRDEDDRFDDRLIAHA